jgi:hypothetical protein
VNFFVFFSPGCKEKEMPPRNLFLAAVAAVLAAPAGDLACGRGQTGSKWQCHHSRQSWAIGNRHYHD